MAYQVQYNIPYEGYTIEEFETLEEVQAWVKSSNQLCYKAFDTYSIYKVELCEVDDGLEG